jgi:hypothetical protein
MTYKEAQEKYGESNSIVEMKEEGKITLCHHWDKKTKIHTIRKDNLD